MQLNNIEHSKKKHSKPQPDLSIKNNNFSNMTAKMKIRKKQSKKHVTNTIFGKNLKMTYEDAKHMKLI